MASESSDAGGCVLAPSRAGSAFATTHWSLVAQAAAAGDATTSRAALEDLCRLYWRPLYAFARRGGLSPHDAEDMTQGFIADLLERGALAHADAARGRFRTFLLAAFKNYASHERARAQAQKRGGDDVIISMDTITEMEGSLRDELAIGETPGKHYARKWATSLLDRALAGVRGEYVGAHKGALFEALKAALWGGRGEINYAEIAARLGTTEGALKVAVHRLRRRFGKQLRAEVGRTVADPAEVDDEVRHLLAAFQP